MPTNIDDIVALLSDDCSPLVQLDADAVRMIYEKAGLPDSDIPEHFKACVGFDPYRWVFNRLLPITLPGILSFVARQNEHDP